MRKRVGYFLFFVSVFAFSERKIYVPGQIHEKAFIWNPILVGCSGVNCNYGLNCASYVEITNVSTVPQQVTVNPISSANSSYLVVQTTPAIRVPANHIISPASVSAVSATSATIAPNRMAQFAFFSALTFNTNQTGGFGVSVFCGFPLEITVSGGSGAVIGNVWYRHEGIAGYPSPQKVDTYSNSPLNINGGKPF